MKRWLITTAADEDLEVIRERVAEHGGTVADAPPVPLDGGEQVVEATGPADLPLRLKEQPAIRKVSPDSDISFYDDRP